MLLCQSKLFGRLGGAEFSRHAMQKARVEGCRKRVLFVQNIQNVPFVQFIPFSAKCSLLSIEPPRKRGIQGAVTEALTNDWPAIIAAILSGLGGLYMFITNGQIKRRDAETANEISLIKAKAEAAANSAAAAKDEVSDSRSERHQQFQEVTKKIQENTAMNESALNTATEAVNLANNTNLKIQQLREDFQSTQPTK